MIVSDYTVSSIEEGSVSLVHNISSKRTIIPVYFGKKHVANGLYDTGSCVTLLNERGFKCALLAGVIGKEYLNHGITLHTASKQPMRVTGVYDVSMVIQGRHMTCGVVVSPDLGAEMIIGANLIKKEGMSLNPWDDTIDFIPRPIPTVQPDWTTAAIQLRHAVSIEALDARLCECALVHSDGSKVGAFVDFYGLLDGEPIAAKTDAKGLVQLYIKNKGNEQLQLPGKQLVGSADNVNLYTIEFDVDAPDREEVIAHIFAVNTAEASRNAIASHKAKWVTRQQTVQGQIPDVTRQAVRKAVEKLPWRQRENYQKLLLSFSDIISTSPADLGRCTTVTHNIHLRDKEPTYTKQFPLPHEELDIIRSNLREWLKVGIVEPSHSLYNAPIFCVKKKEGHGLRVVLDYRRLNLKSLPDRYSIRCVDECIKEVGYSGSKVFTTLDLTSGFWQMDLEKSARPYTAFTVPGMGQFQWTTSPMGLTGCPASFARLMDITMRGLPNVLTYIDDVLIHSKDLDDHLGHLRAALTRLRQHNLKLNLAKCYFGAEEAAYLGHTLTANGVLPGMDKTKAIRDAAPPSNPKEVKSFLGLVNYFRGYVKNFATIASPLFRLTRQTSEWKSGQLPEDALTAFETLKRFLCSTTALAYPNKEGQFHLYVDAATGSIVSGEEGGLGACLMQEQPDGRKQVVAFASKRLIKHERNYAVGLLEMQAVCFGIEQFELYLRGRRFIVYSDHKPIVNNLSAANTKTYQRLSQKLRDYHFEIRYVKGEDNVVADYLSRTAGVACASIAEETPASMSSLQTTCPELFPWIQAKQGLTPQTSTPAPSFLEDLTWDGKRLWFRRKARKGIQDKGAYRVVAPVSIRHKLIREAHNSFLGGHGGFFKTAERIKAEFWWPSMDQDIADHVARCAICQQLTNKGKPAPTPLQPLPEVRRPNARVHVDLFGPLKTATGGKKYILVITDAFTKMVRLAPISTKSKEEVAAAIVNNWIITYGVPEVIFSDQGLEFCNETLDRVCKEFGINRSTTTPYHPRSNAQAEQFNKTMVAYLGKFCKQAEQRTVDWECLIGPLTFWHNTACNKATMTSPFYAMFGYDPNAPLWPEGDVFLRNAEAQEEDSADSDPLAAFHKTQQLVRQAALNSNQHYRAQYQDQYNNSRAVKPALFKPDQPVYVLITASNDENKKIAPKWREATIVGQVHDSVFRVHILGRKRKAYTNLNADKIKPRLEEEEGMDHPGDPVPDDDKEDDLPLRQRFPRRTHQVAPQKPQFTRSRQSKAGAAQGEVAIANLVADIFVLVQDQCDNPTAVAFTLNMLKQLMREGKLFSWEWQQQQGEPQANLQEGGGGHLVEDEPPPIQEDPIPPPLPCQQQQHPPWVPLELRRLQAFNKDGSKAAMLNPAKRVSGKRPSRMMQSGLTASAEGRSSLQGQ